MKNKYKSYTYFGFHQDQFGDRASLGFTGGGYSPDGLYVLGTRGNNEPCPECAATARPEDVTEEMAPNWPEMTFDEMSAITKMWKEEF